MTLPEHIDVVELLGQAAHNGVIFFPGHWFYPHQDRRNTFRLSFSTVPEDRIRLGIERLGNVIRNV